MTLVEAGPHIAYGVCELPEVLAGTIPDPLELVPFSASSFAAAKRVHVLCGQRATRLDADAGMALLRDEQGRERELPFDALVLTTGTSPWVPRTGAALPLKTIADARALVLAARRAPGGRAAVLGAGYVGLLAADALARRGLQVTLFDREAAPLAGFEPAVRRAILERLAAAGVGFVGATEVQTGMVAGADLVVTALGSEPAVALAAQSGIEIGSSGAIRVDERGETSRRGVFAAGDCAESLHAVSGARAPVALATVASQAGRRAGANAAGGRERIRPVVAALVFRVLGQELGRVGLSSGEAARAGFEALAVAAASRPREGDETQVTLIVERSTGRLLGANSLGGDGAGARINILAPLVSRGARVSEIASLELAYAPFLSALRDPILVAAARAERERR